MAQLMNIGGGLYLPDMAAIYKEGRQAKADDYAQQRQQIADQRADDMYGNTQMVVHQAAQGDLAGAKQAALGAGNFATLDHLDQIDDDQRKQAGDDAEFVGRLVPALGKIDGSDGGNARRDAARPYLKARGLTDAQIDAHDFSDHGLEVASSAAMSIKDRLAQQREDREANKPITAADGAVLVSDGHGGYQTIYTPGTKPLTQVVTDPVTGAVRVVNVPGTPGQSVSPGSAPAPAGGNVGAGGFGAIDAGFEQPTEGGYADRDGASGAPVNFGINQKFNPDVDVKNLTPDAAQQIRKERYWDKSGAGNQPTPAGQAIVYDTAVNMGVPTAQRMLKETGGDPAKMLAWREQRYRSIGQNPAQASNLPKWLDRNDRLRQFVGQAGSGQAAPASNGPTITDLGNGGGPVWKDDTRNGVLGQTNTRTGEFKPLPGQKAQDANSLQSGEDAIDQSIASIDKLANHPGLGAAVGSGFDPQSWLPYAFGHRDKAIAGTNAADFETQLDTFKSQQFLSQVAKMKGLGALSDAEGAKLSAAAGNLATNQSEDQFRGNVKIIRDGLMLAKQRIEAQKAQHGRVGQQAQQNAPVERDQRPTRTATNPQTGEKLGLINGQWVALK